MKSKKILSLLLAMAIVLLGISPVFAETKAEVTDYKNLIAESGVNGKLAQEAIKAMEEKKAKAENGEVISPVTKELMYLSFAVAKQCDVCIAVHTQKYIEAGGTKIELAELYNMAKGMQGGPGSVYAGKVFQAFEQLSNEKATIKKVTPIKNVDGVQITDYKKLIAESGVNGKLAQEAIKAMEEKKAKAENGEVISPVTKELMYLSFAVAKQCDVCIAVHTQKYIEAGGTKIELAELYNIAKGMQGGPGSVYAGKVFQAFEQLSVK